MTQTLILLAHPTLQWSRVNAPMADTARSLGEGVQVHDLYAHYPDLFIDVPREQALLAQAQVVVLLFPLQWYAPPALLKLWMDNVLAYGWAYGPEGTALAGKDFWVAVSASGTEGDYTSGGRHGHALDSIYLAPLRQVAAMTGMHWRAPLVLHDARGAGLARLPAHLERWRERLTAGAQPRPTFDTAQACTREGDGWSEDAPQPSGEQAAALADGRTA